MRDRPALGALLIALLLSAGACGGSVVNSGDAPHDAVSTVTCSSPQVDAQTGVVRCQEGFSHRPAGKACEPARRDSASLPRVEGTLGCAQNPAICEQFAFGFCGKSRTGGYPPDTCVSGCNTDADCGASAVCECRDFGDGPHGHCYPSACRADAECGAGTFCAQTSAACGYVRFACQTADDECVADSECRQYCSFVSSGSGLAHRTCDPPPCAAAGGR